MFRCSLSTPVIGYDQRSIQGVVFQHFIPYGRDIILNCCPENIVINVLVVVGCKIPETNVPRPIKIRRILLQPGVVGFDDLTDLLWGECTRGLICVINDEYILGTESMNGVRYPLTIYADTIQPSQCTCFLIHRSVSSASAPLSRSRCHHGGRWQSCHERRIPAEPSAHLRTRAGRML